ncbi:MULTISPECIES: tyrosine--tRNA ligase [unclassified Enterococcus]|uniref:tyrosine--tRNA ligase n=1 Tax=unclassified Enterococcus TaxID=2608891 RepID=UPI001DAAD34B|nr:tyrosine--tRNA ligase [Enterococcus sp. MMGLQ5-1]NPD37445.1 tyrosine--tRNA ligase [Enterococcus sp. MMGLQ5-2]
MMQSFFEELQARGLIYQTTDDEALKEKLNNEKIKLYIGFDPTADSLHIGSLVPILMLRRFQINGHTPYALVGGGTGMIGDPSFKDTERSLNTTETVQNWSNAIRDQLAQFIDFEAKENPASIVNNYDWLGSLSLIDFLRDTGKNFTINYMMSKESVKRRIETGISYTEFAYQLLQGYDFQKLFEDYGIELQVGGSDQWGNITTGTELIRKETGKQGFGLTLPLITTADGKKFGKSEGNAIWLDAQKTTPYEFYQFWLNTTDEDAVRFLKYFTFLTLEEIAQIEIEFNENRGSRSAQKILAREVTALVHGQDAYEQAVHISEILFGGGDLKTLNVKDIKVGLKDVATYNVTAETPLNLVDFLVESKISPSKRQAREDITNGAIYINGERQQKLDYTLSDADKIENELTVIRRGKKKNFLVQY